MVMMNRLGPGLAAVGLVAATLLSVSLAPREGLAGNPAVDRTNAMIGECVDRERAAGRSGHACIGRLSAQCKARPDNAHRADKMECNEREYVLWALLAENELKRLSAALGAAQRAALKKTQELWLSYIAEECRLPYVLFGQEQGSEWGPACSIRHNAARALELRAWRDALAGGAK